MKLARRSESKAAIQAREWWHTPLIPGQRKREADDLCEFKAILDFTRLNLSKRETKLTQR